MVNDQILKSIRNVIDYLEGDEEKDFLGLDEEDREDHIYNDVIKVRKWIDGESSSEV